MTRSIRLALPVAAAFASSAAAQTAPQIIPGLGNYSLPASEPTPVPSPTPTPAATLPVVPTASPAPRSTPATRSTPRATSTAEPDAEPTPRVEATARPRPTPTVAPVPEMPVDPGPPLAPAPTPSAPARIAPPPVPSAEPDGATPWWPWATGSALLLALLLAWLLRRRRFREAVIAEPIVGTSPTPPPEPVSPPLPPRDPAAVARAWLELDLHPRRGGLNLLSATVESEIVLRNTGDAAAEAVLVEATLLPARSGQDAELGALFARPVARPAVPAFALAPGEERRVRVVSALPLAGVEPLMAGGRAMLVPVVAVNATYRWADQTGQTAAAFVIGVERAGQAKLAPFWLDAPRMYEALAARAHALAVRR